MKFLELEQDDNALTLQIINKGSGVTIERPRLVVNTKRYVKNLVDTSKKEILPILLADMTFDHGKPGRRFLEINRYSFYDPERRLVKQGPYDLPHGGKLWAHFELGQVCHNLKICGATGVVRLHGSVTVVGKASPSRSRNIALDVEKYDAEF